LQQARVDTCDKPRCKTCKTAETIKDRTGNLTCSCNPHNPRPDPLIRSAIKMAASIMVGVRPCQTVIFRRSALLVQQQTVKQCKNPATRFLSSNAAPRKNYNYVRIGLGVGAVVGAGLLYGYSMMVPKFVKKIHSTGLAEDLPAKSQAAPDMDKIKRTPVSCHPVESSLLQNLFLM
jgi:hypothetical protein